MQIWRLQKRLHSSWLITLFCVGIVIGVVTSKIILFTNDEYAIPLGACFAACVSLYIARIWVIPLIMILGCVLGLWRGGVELAALSPYESLIDCDVFVKGELFQDPSNTEKQTNIELDRIEIGGQSLGGKIWASMDKRIDLNRGDVVILKGKLSKGFGNISASIFNAQLIQTRHLSQDDFARKARDWFSQLVRQAIPSQQADLGLGFLTGQKSVLTAEFSEDLKNVGLTHIVVASGYNLSILVRLARRLFSRVSKYMATLSGFLMAAGFTLVSGLGPSMTRAATVTGLSLLAWYYGRKFHPIILLSVVGAITLLFDPSFAWGDLGWQLSFAAFVGVMVIAPVIHAFFFGGKKPGTIRQIIGETIGAELMTLPIIVLAFGQFSNVSVLANLLILPFVPLAMLLTFVTGIVALIIPFAATAIGMLAACLLNYMFECINLLAAIPGVKTSLSINVTIVLTYYVVLLAWWLYAWKKTKYNLREANLVE